MWLEQSEGRGGGMRAGCARLCGLLGGLGLLLEGRWVTWRMDRGRKESDSSAHRHPLVAASGKTGHRWARAGARGPEWK